MIQTPDTGKRKRVPLAIRISGKEMIVNPASVAGLWWLQSGTLDTLSPEEREALYSFMRPTSTSNARSATSIEVETLPSIALTWSRRRGWDWSLFWRVRRRLISGLSRITRMFTGGTPKS